VAAASDSSPVTAVAARAEALASSDSGIPTRVMTSFKFIFSKAGTGVGLGAAAGFALSNLAIRAGLLQAVCARAPTKAKPPRVATCHFQFRFIGLPPPFPASATVYNLQI